MEPAETYELLRNLTSPIVAITTTWRGRHNGMVADSAARASLSPRAPRVAIFVQKWNLSHEILLRTGVFVMHVLHRGQWDLIWKIGFFSGRERPDKLEEFRYRLGRLGRPVLGDCFAWLECRIVNVMDGGANTCVLADVVEAGRGPGADVMTAAHFRANLPAEWRPRYLERLAVAQAIAERYATPLEPLVWQGPEVEEPTR